MDISRAAAASIENRRKEWERISDRREAAARSYRSALPFSSTIGVAGKWRRPFQTLSMFNTVDSSPSPGFD
jgi:hypothetical protein